MPISHHRALAQPWVTSFEIHGGWNGTGVGYFSEFVWFSPTDHFTITSYSFIMAH
jgi:hypothetical protein